MKKTLLLSVVASTMIMAGGDIAPVEPVVEAPVVASTWEWSGTAKLYYQTMDHDNYIAGVAGQDGNLGAGIVGRGNSLFDKWSSAADAGLQLRVANKNLAGTGIGFGAEMTGLATLGLVNSGLVSATMQTTNQAGVNYQGIPFTNPNGVSDLEGGYISKAYLTYAFGNTSIKVGRQALPKSLSPFAFSEGWNVFKNTFEAALVVNTDIPDTAIVLAYVTRGNGSLSDAGSIVAITSKPWLAGFSASPALLAPQDLGTWKDMGIGLLTVQNKSIAGLTVTGSYYYGSDYGNVDGLDVDILWGDIAYAPADFPVNVALQGGWIDPDLAGANVDKTSAWGAKIGGTVGPVSLSVAYSDVNSKANSLVGLDNAGTGVKTPLYTQMVLNQVFIDGRFSDSQTTEVKAVYKGLGGKLVAAYGMTNLEDGNRDYNEFDFIYATKFDTSIGKIGTKFMWMNQDFDGRHITGANPDTDDTNNVVRIIVSYDF